MSSRHSKLVEYAPPGTPQFREVWARCELRDARSLDAIDASAPPPGRHRGRVTSLESAPARLVVTTDLGQSVVVKRPWRWREVCVLGTRVEVELSRPELELGVTPSGLVVGLDAAGEVQLVCPSVAESRADPRTYGEVVSVRELTPRQRSAR